MLSKLENMKLRRFLSSFGEMSADEAITLAIEASTISSYLPYDDPVRKHFREQERQFLDYAELLIEKEAT